MHKKTVLPLVCLLKTVLVIGQGSIDALRQKGMQALAEGQLHQARGAFEQVYRQKPDAEGLYWILRSYNLDYPSQLDSALILTKQLIAVKQLPLPKRITILCIGARALTTQSKYDSAKIYIQEAIRLNNPVVSAAPFERMAKLYFMQGDFKKSSEMAYEALQVAQRLQEDEEINYAYLSLGSVHKALKQYKVAEHYLNQLIEREASKKRSATIGLAYEILGNYYADQQDKKSIMKSTIYYQKGLEADLKADRPVSVGYHLMHLGLNYMNIGDRKRAKGYFVRADKYFTSRGSNYDKAAFYVAYGDFLFTTGLDTNQSIQFFKAAAEIFRTDKNKLNEYIATEALYKVYEAKGNYEQAYEYIKICFRIKEELANSENQKSLQELNIKYQTAQQLAQLANQERTLLAEAERSERYLLYILIGVSCSLLIISLLVYRQLRIAKLANAAKEQALRQARRANDAESFSYSVSHDIRTPLLQMRVQIDRILTQWPTLSKPLVEELQRLNHSVENADMLVKRLLFLYSLNQEEHLPTQFEMKSLVEDVYQELMPLHNYTGQFIINDLPAVVADRMLFGQVWQNLLSNAMKYSKHQAKPCLTVSHEPTDLYDVFWIADNGLGLPPGASAALFVPLKRLRRGDDVEGHGLGLAIVKRIVEQHGGEVWAEPLPQGARFGFSLPRMPNKTVAIMA